MDIELSKLTIKKAHEHLKNGDFSAVELAESHLRAVEEKDKEIHAYVEVFDDVLEQAKEADRKITAGEGGVLTGIPIGVKDNILIEERSVSAASKILEGYTASYDATAVKKLKKVGAIFLGRTNMDEFAMGASTENSAHGATKNPHDLTRVPGGSSGGSAAAVAAGTALAALGSDTAGSIRQPSSFCGVVGLKPTYGAVSRSGLIALGSSLDCIGPVARTVEDAELVFNVIKGEDGRDSTAFCENKERKAQNDKREKLKIGIPNFSSFDTKFLHGLVSPDMRRVFESARVKMRNLGYIVKDINISHLKYAVPTYYILLPAEASANLARFDGVKYGLHTDGEDLLGDYLKTRGEGFGPEPKRRILIGTYVLSAGYHDAYYNKALAVRQKITEDFTRAFEEVDIIMTPTTLGPAFRLGEKVDDPVKMYLEDIFTVPANLAGVPALSVPSGFVDEGNSKLPLGVQFIAPHMREDTLFSVGKQFEKTVAS